MMQLNVSTTDLREIVEQQLGKPLAASANAALWRCPVCPLEAHSLLLVAADQFRCLGRCMCAGGASEWMQNLKAPSPEPVAVRETA